MKLHIFTAKVRSISPKPEWQNLIEEIGTCKQFPN